MNIREIICFVVALVIGISLSYAYFSHKNALLQMQVDENDMELQTPLI